MTRLPFDNRRQAARNVIAQAEHGYPINPVELAFAHDVVRLSDTLERIVELAQAEGESEIAHRIYTEATRA